jgi:hypothetical protein
MQRRDLSKILFASSAVTALAARGAQAQVSPVTASFPQSPAESAAGVVPVNTSYMPGDIRRYGADPMGSADSTNAIQTALNINQAVYIPTGNYVVTSALLNGIPQRRIYGDGPGVSVLRPTGAINTIVNTAG